MGRKAIPDSAHPFQAPAASAQRGSCPGLNAMANYGYISRSGITNVGELLWALQESMGQVVSAGGLAGGRADSLLAYSFAPDLAGVLVALGFRGMIDPTTSVSPRFGWPSAS